MGIPPRLVFAAAFLTVAFLLSDQEGVIFSLLFAVLLFAAFIVTFHGHWQTVLKLLWKIWSGFSKHQRRVREQSQCKICGRPTRVVAIEYHVLKTRAPLNPKKCYACGVCGAIALFHINIPIGTMKKTSKDRPPMSNVCLDHHPNPCIGKFAASTLAQLRELRLTPFWVQPIEYEEHIRPAIDETRHHPLCGDHYPLETVGAKCDETAQYFLNHNVAWGALIPSYEPSALISGKDPVRK